MDLNMKDDQVSDAVIFRLINNKDWQGILALLDEGKVKVNRKIVVQMFGERHGLFLLPAMLEQRANVVVKRLLEKGANPNQRYEGRTLLLIACHDDNHEAVELLLNANADLEQTAACVEGEGGETALMLAAQKNDLRMVERLLKAGANPRKITAKKKQSPIWFATSTDCRKTASERNIVIRKLIAAGCKLVGNELHWPIYRRDSDLTGLLLESGSPLNEPLSHNEPHGPSKGDTPLTISVETNFVDMAAFGEAVSKARGEIILRLLSAKADPNIPNGKGHTPLLLTVLGNDLKTARILLNAGANPRLSPSNSKAGSAVDLAKKRNATEFIKLFTTF